MPRQAESTKAGAGLRAFRESLMAFFCIHIVSVIGAKNEGTDVYTSAGDAHECDMEDRRGFHGCVSLLERNRTLVSLQTCLDGRWLNRENAAQCSRMFDGLASPAGSPDVSCGFKSSAAHAWLASLHHRVAGCTHVVFAVILGGSDKLRPFKRAPTHFVTHGELWCAIAFIDAHRLRHPQNDTRTLHPSAYWDTAQPWVEVGVDVAAMFHSAARTSKAIRVSSMRLFPAARSTIYVDGKLVLLLSPPEILRQVLQETRAPFVALEHPTHLDSEGEFARAIARIRSQRRPSWREDVKDALVAQALYAAEGMFNHQAGLADNCMLLENREGGPTVWSGREPASARAVLQSFSCAWFNEIAVLSQRTQLSFIYLLDLLGLRRYVYIVPRRRYLHRPVWFRQAAHLA